MEDNKNIIDISNNKINSEEKIPRIIIQTWKTKEIPEKYIKYVESIKKYNPEFEIKLFSDEDIVNFLSENYPSQYEIYQKIPKIIQKIDYFRYVAIYHYGGFYFDLDMIGLKSIKELCKKSCIFPIDTIINSKRYLLPRFRPYYKRRLRFLLGQYAFAAEPKHSFIKSLIDNIDKNINNLIIKSKTSWGKSLNYVYKTTGPDYVTDVFLSYKKRADITILHFPKDQYFGQYAKHDGQGTWK